MEEVGGGLSEARITRVEIRKKGVPRKLLMRRWLNKRGHHSTAFVYANLSCHEYGRETDDKTTIDRELNGELCISDCTRQITLEILNDVNTVYKLDKLLEAIEEVRTYVVEAMEWIDG
jgi:hypothetical protein